jgi:putative heme-binding domain-containing protein
MTNARKLTLFIMAVSAAFVYICNVIPQIKSEPVVEEQIIGASPEELVAAGKRIFMSDRAQCLTCHSLGEDPKARCPNQEGLGDRASNQKPGISGAEYLVESVYNPNAFIVSGYPKNQMQPVNKPPIALSHDEILAVITYLNTLGGTTDMDFVEQLKKAQEPWRQGLLKAEEGEEKFRPPVFKGDVVAGHENFQQICIKCHRVGPEGRDIGPELTQIGASQSGEYILESVLDPNAVIVRGYKETIVMWKERGRESLRGTALEWYPEKDRPQRLRLGVLVGEETEEREVDLTEAACVGDTVVGIERDGKFQSLCGEYVSGDEETGITLTVFNEGFWVEEHFTPEEIDFMNAPMSPMPANFSEEMTPREIYDLVAYLLAQKGEE